MSDFSTGLSSLRTSQFALEVISNNIANADTEGFHRRSVHQQETRPTRYGTFQVGTGVSIRYIERIRNQVTESSLTDAISDASRIDQTLDIERQIESLFQTGEGSLNQRIDVFFAELTKLTSTPGEVTQRGVVVEQANQLARVFHQISDQLTNLRSAIRYQVGQEVDALNGQMTELVDLKGQVDALSETSDPNRELDQLDQLINEIATVIDVSRNEHFAAGSTIAFGGSINQYHQGTNATEFKTETDENGRLVVVIGELGQVARFEGGRLPSLIDAYNDVIPEFTQRLDELAAGFIQQFDQIHATGVGPSGSFSLLQGSRPVEDPAATLDESGLAFPVSAGRLYFSLTDPSGSRLTESIAIDPETQTLEDVALAITNLDNLNASVNPQTNQLQVIAAPGYQFDFTGSLETNPRLTSYTGSAIPAFSGDYLGDITQNLTYEIQGTGDVGVSDDLFVNVFNEEGAQIARLEIGSEYEAGSELEILEGVKVAFPPGAVVDGDSFSSVLVAEPDETGFLSALGLNSFFVGDDANSIDVNEQIQNDVNRFASGVSDNVADTTNLFFMIELQQVRGMSGGRQTFNEYLNEVTTTIGIRVNTSSQLSASLNGLKTKYEQDRDSISGVDLNEELVSLQQYQKQYEASLRVIRTAEVMLEELFTILR